MVSPQVVQNLQKQLIDPTIEISQKYRILFSLRNIESTESQQALISGLRDPSALFRHEVAYCLGQRRNPDAVTVLASILQQPEEHSMVRHEAGEALGAIGTPECLEHLQHARNDPCLEVAQTCQLALQRIAYYSSAEGAGQPDESRYLSVDPAPAYPAATPTAELRTTLLNEDAEIFDRYRALFALRNQGTAAAVEALGASFTGNSALLKHEVAYVLGQMQDKHAVDTLRAVLLDESENAMVRHEAAEALGSIAAPQCLELLKECCKDPEPIVADSCIVALGMLEYELSGEFQYAEVGVDHNITAPQLPAVEA